MYIEIKKAMPANGLNPQANTAHPDEQAKAAVLMLDFNGTAPNAQERATGRLRDFGLPDPQDAPKTPECTYIPAVLGTSERRETEPAFDFLAYLREQHRYWLTQEPQTEKSISERRRLARMYAEMKAIEPAKGRGVGR